MQLITDNMLVRRNKSNIELIIAFPSYPLESLSMDYGQAKELKDILEHLLDDISADGCGMQLHSGD
ncbi:MAG: hypothetical protein WCS17_03460 [Prevotella sp.]